MEELTEIYINAIKQFMNDNELKQSDLAKKIKTTQPTVARWLNGTAKTIRNYHWGKLYPLISQYLPEDNTTKGGYMKLTREMQSGIMKAIEHYGTAVELAKLTGIKQQNFSRYLSGQVKQITLETWQKLYPLIAPYLPDDYTETGTPHTPRTIQVTQQQLMTCPVTGKHACPLEEISTDRKYLISKIQTLTPEEVEKMIAYSFELTAQRKKAPTQRVDNTA